MRVTLIVAADDKDGIARDRQIPWHIREDLRRFKALTTGSRNPPSAVLMGRATWESLPDKVRPLPDRKNIVLSRSKLDLPGAHCVGSWREALDAASGAGHLWVIGGAAVYALALAEPETTAIELTRVDGDFNCDLLWPGVPHGYVRVGSEAHDGFRFERWVHPNAVDG
jgi:dihydrofolate reductase